jgi:membrane protein YdbS with pleckstrin-like domain
MKMKTQPAIIGKEFKPSAMMKSLYFSYLAGAVCIGLLVWIVPIGIFESAWVAAAIFSFFLPFILFAAYWIPKYYATITYKLTKDEMTWRRGVWFRNTGIVPYNRITNVDITQGPVSRHFRVASLRIQTAGYSGANTRSAEIRLDGIEDFEGLREYIMDLVRGRAPMAVESYSKASHAGSTDAGVLTELVRIRKLLERRK